MEVKVSAPGKITLFGEHAVVYGKPAIVTSIEKRVYVTARVRSDNTVKVYARDLHVKSLELSISSGGVRVEVDRKDALRKADYIIKAVELTLETLNVRKGLELEISSTMPVGAGLGTSAAISVATIYGCVKALGYDIEKRELSKLGHRVELEVQGAASPMDTAIATFGGTLWIHPRSGGEPVISEVKAPELPIIVGYVPRIATTGELVANVRMLKERWGGIVDRVLEGIEEATFKALGALEKGELELLGELMNINHGLLEALGVSSYQLNMMVYAARRAGALGAKLTGAGGGGCMIALAPRNAGEVVAAIKAVGGDAFQVRTGVEGVRVEYSKPPTY